MLTESNDAAAYWRKLKQRLKAEGNETVTNCHSLKMVAADGKRRMTDVATTKWVNGITRNVKGRRLYGNRYEETTWQTITAVQLKDAVFARLTEL